MKINLVESGIRIKQIREEHNYTMADLGKLVDTSSPSTINNWEKGNNLPNKNRLEKIALLGNTTTDWIKYGGVGDYVCKLTYLQEKEVLTRSGEDSLIKYRNNLLEILNRQKISYEEDLVIIQCANHLLEILYMNENDSPDNKPNPKLTGQRIRTIRKSKNMTMKEFADLIGSSQKGNVNNWERGFTLPNKKRLSRIAEIGDTTVEWLLHGRIDYKDEVIKNLKLENEKFKKIIKNLRGKLS